MSGDLSMCHNTRQMQLRELEPLGRQEPLSPWSLGRHGGGGEARGGRSGQHPRSPRPPSLWAALGPSPSSERLSWKTNQVLPHLRAPERRGQAPPKTAVSGPGVGLMEELETWTWLSLAVTAPPGAPPSARASTFLSG